MKKQKTNKHKASCHMVSPMSSRVASRATLSLVGITFCLGAILSSHTASADDNTSVVDQINITVPVSCTLSGTGMDSHNAEINNGQYNSNIGTTTLKAFCNDNEGFSIYAVGYTDNEIGKNVLTNSTLGQTYDIVTGTAISGNTSNWAMKLNTTTSPTPTYPIIIMGSTDDAEKQAGDPDYSTFQNVPSSYAKVAKRESSTDVGTNAEGATLTTTYQAYISPTQAAGTYTGQVKYTMVHPHDGEAPLQPQPSTQGTITYYANAANAQGTIGNQDKDDAGNDLADGATVTLYASNFSRTGYGFAGWTDAYDYATNPNANFYGPQETITVPEGTAANGLSLYAVWVKSTGSLQDTDKVAELCGTATTNGTLVQAPAYGTGTANLSSVSALTDQRDNQTYAIAKLADGKCWMIENLRLEAEDSRGNNRFNSSITNESLAQGYNSSFIGLANPEFKYFSNSTAQNSLYTIGSNVDGRNTISGSDRGYRFPRYNNFNTNQRVDGATNIDENTYSYGNYYSWAAVVADTTRYTSGDHNTASICPTGWRIPKGYTGGEYYNLFHTLNANANTGSASFDAGLRSYPNNYLYSGSFKDASASNRGDTGTYWSSSVNSSSTSYALHLNSSYVAPGTINNPKHYGFSIRCVTSQ